MKRFLTLKLILVVAYPVLSQKTLNVMTFNIRLDVKSDGPNQWSNRKVILPDMIRYYEADICGLQEAQYHQIEDIEVQLPQYAYVGKGRDDGQKKGEFSCIFYNKKRLKVLQTNTLWLNEHPDTPGHGWDAHYNRIVTWAEFKDRATNQKFFVFNTHFDHQGVQARRESALLVLKWVAEIAGERPCIVMGDFNATPADEPVKLLSTSLLNTKKLSESPHFGPESTFNGFETKEQENREIDHVFVKNWKGKILNHATLSNTWGGRFASDHHAVMTKVQIK